LIEIPIISGLSLRTPAKSQERVTEKSKAKAKRYGEKMESRILCYAQNDKKPHPMCPPLRVQRGGSVAGFRPRRNGKGKRIASPSPTANGLAMTEKNKANGLAMTEKK